MWNIYRVDIPILYTGTAISFVKLFKDFHINGEREILCLIKSTNHSITLSSGGHRGGWLDQEVELVQMHLEPSIDGTVEQVASSGDSLGAKAPAPYVQSSRCVSSHLLAITKPLAQRLILINAISELWNRLTCFLFQIMVHTGLSLS